MAQVTRVTQTIQGTQAAQSRLMSQPLLLATCRFAPLPSARNADVPLAAGHYELLRLTPRPDAAGGADGADGSNGSNGLAARSLARGQCLSCAQSDLFEAVSEPELPSGDLVLVVHGFNCTAFGGIQTAYYIRDSVAAWGLPLTAPDATQRPGELRVVGFTWPCEHTLVPGYMDDKAAVARFAAFSLANLILDLRRAEPDRQIHIVAHSMGCFLTLKALNMVAVLHQRSIDLPAVNQVVWLAPDINADALERSTPEAGGANVSGWRALSPHPRAWRPLRHMVRFWRQAAPITAPTTVPTTAPTTGTPAPTEESQIPQMPVSDHPLDGYGYAALDALEELRIYSSFYDEALVVSPWANQTTEESTSASGAIRLGWCGPLHPERMLPRRVVGREARANGRPRPHQVTLLECSAVVHEHGDYFFVPVVQRDLAAALEESQLRQRHESPALEVAPALTPPPERRRMPIWRRDGRLPAFLPQAGQVEGALRYFRLSAVDSPRTELATEARVGAPPLTPATGWARLGLALWHSFLGRGYVRLARAYYGV